jgi:hypothetical protein
MKVPDGCGRRSEESAIVPNKKQILLEKFKQGDRYGTRTLRSNPHQPAR